MVSQFTYVGTGSLPNKPTYAPRCKGLWERPQAALAATEGWRLVYSPDAPDGSRRAWIEAVWHSRLKSHFPTHDSAELFVRYRAEQGSKLHERAIAVLMAIELHGEEVVTQRMVNDLDADGPPQVFDEIY